MYRTFFQLDEEPFNVTPDPRFLYASAAHRRALDLLRYGIESRKGFMTLTGEVGCGKTTVCRAVLDRLPEGTHSALILNPALTETQIIRAILSDLGLPPRGRDRLTCIEQLNGFLLECLDRGENAAVIIDESQDLSTAAMEQVRLLSNLETDRHKLMQIILAGQPELRERLLQPELRQLRQRIMLACELTTLPPGEVPAYINHRLRTAGAPPEVRFHPQAEALVSEYGEGVPRRINTLCDRAMLAAYVRGGREVIEADARKAVEELAEWL
ncbi:ExeA family protein [Kiritimatiella glycovorans]|uniref:Putative secretion ATPase, PEP-CTERM locus subfamily n=1 Tax=Kiritimatiella glycovorans TaxID=1307763 RepID=A0A0G3EB86_9BACT|nr:AAA family ATPase [Kiritimatiella glycovorans]AKJ63553.1 putative secretion ATPase, PEP-CTERM locus subfamily [Kiritimatiella glycovorans]